MERDYREANISEQAQYAEGDINPNKSNNVTTGDIAGGLVGGRDVKGVAGRGTAGRDIRAEKEGIVL